MAVTETKVMYQSSDGREFDTLDDAVKHDEFTAAREAYERAVAVYGKRIAESTKTLDGIPFVISMWHDYWHVSYQWGRCPVLEKVNFTLPYFEIHENDEVRIRMGMVYEDRRRWSVNELYYEKKNALEALAVAIDEYLVEVHKMADILKNPSYEPANHAR